MRDPKLTDDDVVQLVHHLCPQWSLKDGVIVRTFAFADFVAAMRFVNAMADAAEAADHHPDIDIRYNKVTLVLTTHDSGGLTERDFALATFADTLSA
jgi:4a-hydroxytetrahydrobiopterin dehydratase